MTSLEGKESKEALIIKDKEDRDNSKLKKTGPAEDLEELGIDPNHPEWVVHVRRMLLKEFKAHLQKLLIALGMPSP